MSVKDPRRPHPDQELPDPPRPDQELPPVRNPRPDQELPPGTTKPAPHPSAPEELPNEPHEPPLPPQKTNVETVVVETEPDLPKNIPTAMPNYPQNDVKE